MKSIELITPSGKSHILIGSGLLGRCGELINEIDGECVVAIVTDDVVDNLYSSRVVESLEKSGHKVVKYVFPNGEKSKNMETYVGILDFLTENKISRSDMVVALGGGVVGDLAGFAAATYLRGVHLVQIPTTLLAAVDSSVGGKTAVNLKSGKNQAGCFYQPELVICDYNTHDTLPEHIYSDGCAEIIKYGMICDKALFLSLKDSIRENIENIIARCVEIKKNIVEQDELDVGLRQLLNFGHTFGHAIEKCSSYSIQHGSAVAIGMTLITRACVKRGRCSTECLSLLLERLQKNYLPTETDYTVKELNETLKADKKRKGNTITLVLPEAIGKCILEKTEMDVVRKYLELGIGAD